MMATGYERTKQCENCPWRKDAPAAEFSPRRYKELFLWCVVEEAAVMACHKSTDDKPQGCVGFLAHEARNLRLPRMAMECGELDDKELVLAPVDQYGSFEEMARANGADVPDRHEMQRMLRERGMERS